MSDAIVFIPLTQGKVAVIDFVDFAAVRQYKWHAQKARRGWYARCGTSKPRNFPTNCSLHRFLMPGSERLDHVDGDGLNNRRSNLRIATALQNSMAFQRKRTGKTSEYRGVYWHRRSNKWMAQIRLQGRPVYLGIFEVELDAARAYDVASLARDPDFNCLNFPAVVGEQ